MVGAFLVAVAAVGIFAAYQQAAHGPSTRYVVAARSLVAGRPVSAADVTTIALDLPPVLRNGAITAPGAVIGHLLLANIAVGELVQRSAVAASALAQTGQDEVSFSVDPARSLGDRIVPGDVIDILTTTDGRTTALARQVRVLDRESRGGGGFIYTVGLSDQVTVNAVAAAGVAGSLTLVRSDGPGPAAPPPGAAFPPANQFPTASSAVRRADTTTSTA